MDKATVQKRFSGVWTALITPFLDNEVDVEALKDFVQWQIDEGINGVVACGSTGEHSTLSDEERILVVRTAVEASDGIIPVLAGIGSNDTKRAVKMAIETSETDADGLLVVSPYYNKPTQEGLYLHFKAIAEAVPEIPIILYNIPGRTAVNMQPETMAMLYELPNIVGVKQATGEAESTKKILGLIPDFLVLSGDDGIFLPICKAGGRGVISVASNVWPSKIIDLWKSHENGEVEQAEAAHNSLQELFSVLFVETNPIPVKAALAMMKKVKPIIRLPLTWIQKNNAKRVRSVLESYGLL